MRVLLILTAMFSGLLFTACLQGDEPVPPRGVDAVSVVFRGRTHDLKPLDAQKLASVALALLESAREEQDLAKDGDGPPRHEMIQKRSCLIVRFAQPRSVPRPGNKQGSVQVETLIIPFSPDLDPETIYVLPGKPVRVFANFSPDRCQTLRSMLVHAGIYPAAPGAVISGIVRVTGTPPTPKSWKVDEAIERAFGLTRYTEETWLVGADQGLRNCVVTLRPKNPAWRMSPRPLPRAAIDKDMVRYDPRILVVTPGTPVTLSNTNSPCKGYLLQTTRLPVRTDLNFLISEGEERTIVLNGADVYTINCPARPYARGYLHVVDTPYYAVTNSAGKFTISHVPPDDYDITVWHEAGGRLTKQSGPATLTVKDGGSYSLNYTVPVPGNNRK